MRAKEILVMLGIAVFAVMLVLAVKNVFAGRNGGPDSEPQDNTAVTGAAVGADAGDVQVVELSFKGYNYYPDTIRVKKDVPVRIIADTSKIQGCMKYIVSPGLGIKKLFQPGDNVLEFTPTKAGSFPFSCPMGMGRGTIVVEA